MWEVLAVPLLQVVGVQACMGLAGTTMAQYNTSSTHQPIVHQQTAGANSTIRADRVQPGWRGAFRMVRSRWEDCEAASAALAAWGFSEATSTTEQHGAGPMGDEQCRPTTQR